MPEKPPSVPEIEVVHEEERERDPSHKESAELYFNAAGFDTHPKLTPERRQLLKAYILWNDGTWNHTDGYYHDTYVKIGGRWFIQSEEIQSIRETRGILAK